MVRIKDVAELAGINRSIVSRIINGEGKFRDETRKKVEAAMAELNYRPSAIARSLALHRVTRSASWLLTTRVDSLVR